MRCVLNTSVIGRPGHYEYDLLAEFEAEAWLRAPQAGLAFWRETDRFRGGVFKRLSHIRDAPGAPDWSGCKVVSVSPLIRELLSVCSQQPWDYSPASRSSHLAQVLLEQLEVHEQAPLELPELSDPRAKRVAAMPRADPADRRPLAELASAAGASHRTIERLFATETRVSFGRWRLRHRMITALEKLANGDSVSNVADEVGYESPSSFIAAFKDSFGTTPTSYFENMHNRRVSKQ